MQEANRAGAPASVFPVHHITPREGAVGGELVLLESIDNEAALQTPHRHSFTQLVLIESGSGTHHIDFTPFPIRPGELHLLAPGQVHDWQADAGFKCLALMFSEDVLDPIGALPDTVRELLLLGAAPIVPASKELTQIRRLFEALSEAGSPGSTRHLLAALLHDCASAQKQRTEFPAHSPLTRAFLRRVLRAPDAKLSVANCASSLSVTSGHLAEQIAADTGSTPSRILRSAVTREAQRLLSGTDISAAQISHRLGFSEASYFSRFFRREVGCTPTEYRDLGAHAMTSVLTQAMPHAISHARKERHAG